MNKIPRVNLTPTTRIWNCTLYSNEGCLTWRSIFRLHHITKVLLYSPSFHQSLLRPNKTALALVNIVNIYNKKNVYGFERKLIFNQVLYLIFILIKTGSSHGWPFFQALLLFREWSVITQCLKRKCQGIFLWLPDLALNIDLVPHSMQIQAWMNTNLRFWSNPDMTT